MAPTADTSAVVFLARLIDVLLEWLTTGRFPREEFRVHPMLFVLFAMAVIPVVAALALQAFR